MHKTGRDRDSLQRDYKRRLKALRTKLVAARKECKLNQATVARMLGTTQSYISKIERTGRVDAIRMERLAIIYRMPLSDFLTLPLDTREGDYYMNFHEEGWKNPPHNRRGLMVSEKVALNRHYTKRKSES